MNRWARWVGGFALALVAGAAAFAQPLPTARPEDVGMSSARLGRIAQTFAQYIDDGKLPGVVVMVARRGKLVYSEALGFEDKPAGTRCRRTRYSAPIP